jgi:Na+/proline symporter
LALIERRHVHGLRDFFPLTHFLRSDQYGRSTAAAGISLATVILALVNLTPILGLGLLVTIASYAASFVLLYFCAPTILRANPNNDTIQAFLGKSFGSAHVRDTALFFTFIGYTSIFAMELLVGVTVLEPFFGSNTLIFASVYLVFLVLYSIISGFRAVVATEQWQIRLIIAAVLSLFLILALFWMGEVERVSISEISNKVLHTIGAPLSFVIGIVALNLPATISDAGTWQRLCATKSESEARHGLLRAIGIFILLWGSLIVASTFISQLAVATGQFDPARGTLMAHIITRLATGDAFYLALLFVFILGLFAAMITTADSLLLVAAQMYAIDFARLPEQAISEHQKINKARWILTSIAGLAFVVFVFFRLMKFDVIQLVFAIYGAQLALFPTVAASLFLKKHFNPTRAKPAALLSIAGGFIGAWSSAFYGKLSGEMSWTYNAPVVALVVSFVLLILASRRAWQAR